MNIYYDYQVFFIQKYGGVSKYFINLSNQLKEKHNVKIISPIYTNYYLKNFDSNTAKKIIYLSKIYKNTRTLSRIINNYYTKIYCLINRPDIFHFTFYSDKIYLKKKFPFIITVYDLIHEIYAKKFDYTGHSRLRLEYLNNADKIICISNNTKKDLLKFYNIDEKKISVIYLGFDKSKNFKTTEENLVRDPFLLYVGDRTKYKNFKNFISAFSKSSKLKKDFKVICFGSNKFSLDEINFFNSLNLKKNQVIHISGTDEELNFIYSRAHAFIFPSLYEGFGLPLLEAMNMGCPVICSNTSSFPEVIDGGAETFDPTKEDDIVYKIEKVVYSDENIQKLKLKSKEILEKFSWEKCASETLEVYKKLKK